MEPCKKCKECNKLCEVVPGMAGTFKALGDLTRLQIIYLLSTDTSGTLGVSELAARLGISQPAVSQHLKTLKAEGIVDSRREGFYVYYTVNRERIVQFREHFELMYASVMENCDRELIRKMTQHKALNACVVFFSYTGITRAVARQIRNACGCDLVEVKTRKEYSTFTAYTTGVLRSRNGACDAILPETIDVSRYELLIIGTPVWAWKPAPAINAAVRALTGCEGKKAVVFVTSCGQPGVALPLLRTSLASRGVEVVSESSLTRDDMESQNAGNDLIGRIVESISRPGS
jgi:DNA-binding transcriptional ArsR family regulator